MVVNKNQKENVALCLGLVCTIFKDIIIREQVI